MEDASKIVAASHNRIKRDQTGPNETIKNHKGPKGTVRYHKEP